MAHPSPADPQSRTPMALPRSPAPERSGGPDRLALLLADPAGFAWRVLKAFKANQGLLLAGAVAYYALLSIVPLLILSVIALSHWVEAGRGISRYPCRPSRRLNGSPLPYLSSPIMLPAVASYLLLAI